MTADLARLFEEYYPSLVRMLYRRTGDRDRAEDLAQETFARAVSAPPDNPRPWLFAVALNLVREDGRKAVTRGRRLELLRNEQDRPAAGPDADFERNEDVARVRAALAQAERAGSRGAPAQGGGIRVRRDRFHAGTRQRGGRHYAGASPAATGRSVSRAGTREPCRILTKALCTPCSTASWTCTR